MLSINSSDSFIYNSRVQRCLVTLQDNRDHFYPLNHMRSGTLSKGGEKYYNTAICNAHAPYLKSSETNCKLLQKEKYYFENCMLGD